MKLYCTQNERFTPRNWGFCEWAAIASIVVSVLSAVLVRGLL